MTPYWPDSLGMLSRGMRRRMVHHIAGASLLSSHFFPDNTQLYQVLYQLMKRHVFLARKRRAHLLSSPACPSTSPAFCR
jgi:hypothetical protein